MSRPSIFGRGFAFPLRLDANGSKILFSSEEEHVRQGMNSLLNTDISERPHLVRNGVPYGTRMRRMIFDSSAAAVDVARFDVRNALEVWEPRIVVIDVSATAIRDEQGADMVVVNVQFRYRATNRVDNYVIPYRLQPLPAAA